MVNKSIELMKEIGAYPNNFLYEIRDNSANNAPMVSINELNAKSLIDRHSKDGYIVISPCRGGADFGIDTSTMEGKQKLNQINRERIKEFISILKETNFSYTPVYGGFIENKGSDDEETVYERSFIVYNRDKQGKVGNWKDLYDFALEMTKKYNQDSVLIKAPNKNAEYVDREGNNQITFSDNVSFNDISQDYFTDLHKNTHKYKDDMDKRQSTRFSYVESYINPAPQCLSESHLRYLNCEVFIPYKK